MPGFNMEATASVLGYVATILLIGGFVLLLAGLGILDIKAITIAKGRKTATISFIMILLGIGGLLFDIFYQPPTPTEVAGVTFTPTTTPAPPTSTPTSTLAPTATPAPPTGTPVPTEAPVSPTDTPVPPTSTSKPIVPTSTPTPVPAKPTMTLAPVSRLESERAVQIAARGTIQIGVHSTGLWPLSIRQGDSYSGFEIDLAQEIVKRLFNGQVSIEWIPLTPQERFPVLQSGQIDLLIRNTTHTLSREEFGLWTGNYFLDGSRLLVRRNEGLTGIESLNRRSVSIVAGTKWETDLHEAATAAGVQITAVSFDDDNAAFTAFTEGRTDAYISDWLLLLSLSQGDPAYQVVGAILSSESLATSEPLAIGIPPNNPDFRDEVNDALQEIIADGTWEMFYDRCFPDPPPWTLEEMLVEPPPNR